MSSEAISYVHDSMDHQQHESDRVEDNLHKLGVECVGTMFLVIVVGLNVLNKNALGAIGIGFALVVLVFFGGHISGAHYNPAVSLAIFVRGKLKLTHLFAYSAAQLLGGALGGVAAFLMHPAESTDGDLPGSGSGFPVARAFAAETLFTFLLGTVVLNVATTRSQEDNSFFGLAIGLTLMVSAISIGPISGAVLNPAVGTGLYLGDWLTRKEKQGGSALWLFYVAPLFGGLLAGLFFRVVNKREYARQGNQLQSVNMTHRPSQTGYRQADSAGAF